MSLSSSVLTLSKCNFNCFNRFTCLQTYKNLLNELGDQAGQHEMIAENLSTSVAQELLSLIKQLKDDRRKVRQKRQHQSSIFLKVFLLTLKTFCSTWTRALESNLNCNLRSCFCRKQRRNTRGRSVPRNEPWTRTKRPTRTWTCLAPRSRSRGWTRQSNLSSMMIAKTSTPTSWKRLMSSRASITVTSSRPCFKTSRIWTRSGSSASKISSSRLCKRRRRSCPSYLNVWMAWPHRPSPLTKRRQACFYQKKKKNSIFFGNSCLFPI